MLRGLTGLVAVIIIFGALFGLAIGGVDLLNPATSSAEARQINEQTAALASKNAYEQSVREIEIEKQRALAQKDLFWYDRKMSLMEDVVSLLALGIAASMVGAGAGIGIYIGCRGINLLQQRRAPSRVAQLANGKILRFPSPAQRRQHQEADALSQGDA